VEIFAKIYRERLPNGQITSCNANLVVTTTSFQKKKCPTTRDKRLSKGDNRLLFKDY